jgi:hypothetical protein
VSTASARRVLLERLGGGGVALLAVCLEQPAVPTWCDGADGEGRAVHLVGRHQLGDTPESTQAVGAVLEALQGGAVPTGVHAIGFAPQASRAWAAVVAGDAEQVLIDGPRGVGKTQLVAAALACLSELHARAGYALPLRVLWLHDSLVSAGMKTARSLEHPLWGGRWQLEDDRRVATLVVGGTVHVIADFVGALDSAGQERARAECHVVVGEELVSSLDESAGVPERVWDTARSSMRLPTGRRVALATTNPGDVTTWPYRRWIEGGGQPGTARCPVPAEDRLTEAERDALRATFASEPDLLQRLALGVWAPLRLGQLVAEGYDAAVHVSATVLRPDEGRPLVCGWDGGATPSCVVGQRIGEQVRVYASFNGTQGVEELAVDEVGPWLEAHAPWAKGPQRLVHVIDPSMRVKAEAARRVSSEQALRDTLGGRIAPWPAPGADHWAPRRQAVVRVCGPRLAGGQVGLQITPGRPTEALRMALGAHWIYPQTPGGAVDRTRAKKPSRFADLGDAFAYLCGWLRPGLTADARPVMRKPYTARGAASGWTRAPWGRLRGLG